MTGITSRFVMLIATAAVAPLVLFGAVSIDQMETGIEETVIDGNTRLAQQVASQLQQYVQTNARVLRSVAQELDGTHLETWQQSRILKNHVLEFPEFRELTLFDPSGRPIASSRFGTPVARLPAPGGRTTEGVHISPIFEDEDNLPATQLSVRVDEGYGRSGWLVGRISLEELWRFVDSVHVGRAGYALVLSEDQRLVAHGDPNQKRYVAFSYEPQPHQPLPRVTLLTRRDPAAVSFAGREIGFDGREKLFTAARVPVLNWTAMVEQPTSEAFAMTGELRSQLLASIALALLGTLVLGWIWSRSFIDRILALTAATRAIAAGRMDERVRIGGRDEIHELGTAFNSMADRLVELQEDVRKQERQAMFGRIAAGLVHDLSHPIQNIGNSCKLIMKMFDDLEYRETFKRTVEREMVIIKRVLDDLRNIARPIPLERFPVDVNRSIAEAVDTMQQHAETAGVTLRAVPAPEPIFIDGDLFALGRVYRNLILNAIQATAPGGSILVEAEGQGETVRVRVQDTGCGIPADRLAAIFEDFVTTKRRGLGLGLAISRKIVDQLGGRITVTSEVGKGTTFVLEFPRTRARPVLAAG